MTRSLVNNRIISAACPGIRKGGGPKCESLFLLFNISGGGGPSSENSCENDTLTFD